MRFQKSLSRRQMLKTLGAGTVAATVSAAWSELRSSTGQVKPVGPKVKAFELTDVRLADGPFLQAQQLNARYLLQLESDRLLHNFRVNSGVKPKAPVYGGWESVEPWVDIRCHGHTLGHYLSACAMMFAASGDVKFKLRVDYIVADLRECQIAGRTGLICAFPDGQAPLDQIRETTKFDGVPWYTMHKIFAGLRDAYLHANNKTALDVLVKLSDWAINHTKDLSDDQFQRMLKTEHGGMNEVLASGFVGSTCAGTRQARRSSLKHSNSKSNRIQPTLRTNRRRKVRDRCTLFLADSCKQSELCYWWKWRRRALLSSSRLSSTTEFSQDDGDLLHSQHAEADPKFIRA
jgi:Beta-L-arabinofuranosidase, GH127 catalytic domain